MRGTKPKEAPSPRGQVWSGSAGALYPWLAMGPSWLAVIWLVSKAQWVWSNRPEYQFGWMVLALSGYLIWEAWERKPAAVSRPSPAALFCGALGLALLFIIQLYHAALGMSAASLAGLAGGVMLIILANLGWLFGWAGIRVFGFGFFFLLLALPLPSVLYNLLVSGLQGLIVSWTVEMLGLLGVPARSVGRLIEVPGGVVGIDEACSGIRSLQSSAMAALFIGRMVLRSPVLQAGLLLAGVGWAIAGNLGRSVLLSYLAHAKGISAVDDLHDAAGWTILLFTVTGVITLAWLMARAERRWERLRDFRG